MKVISFIEQPSAIRRILKHLDFWEDPRPPPQPLEIVCEPDADYIPWQDDVPGSPGNHGLRDMLVSQAVWLISGRNQRLIGTNGLLCEQITELRKIHCPIDFIIIQLKGNREKKSINPCYNRASACGMRRRRRTGFSAWRHI